MKTYLLSHDETDKYLRDLIDRLDLNGGTVWCPITKSGTSVLARIARLVGNQPNAAAVLPISIENGQPIFNQGNPEEVLKGKKVILIDGAIHSGTMMMTCADKILEYDPLDIFSYSLVVKECSRFIPTMWGVMIDEMDRAYFLLEAYPNNRLSASPAKLPPPVHVRKLDENTVSRPPVVSGVDSIDRVRWEDRHFQMQLHDSTACTYVLERGKLVLGFLTVHISDDVLSIDEIAIDNEQKSKGYGGILMRFADTLGRQLNVQSIRLNAIKAEVDFYKKRGYTEIPGQKPLLLGKEEYFPMSRQVLYHQKPLY